MNPYDSVDKRLSALAEWLKSNATSAQEASNADFNSNKLYQNHVTYFHHPYANFAGQFADNGFGKKRIDRLKIDLEMSSLLLLES